MGRKPAGAHQVPAGDGFLDIGQPVGRSAVEDPTAALTRAGSDVDEPVRVAHHVEGVLDDEEAVPPFPQPVEDAQQRVHILRVEPG